MGSRMIGPPGDADVRSSAAPPEGHVLPVGLPSSNTLQPASDSLEFLPDIMAMPNEDLTLSDDALTEDFWRDVLHTQGTNDLDSHTLHSDILSVSSGFPSLKLDPDVPAF